MLWLSGVNNIVSHCLLYKHQHVADEPERRHWLARIALCTEVDAQYDKLHDPACRSTVASIVNLV